MKNISNSFNHLNNVTIKIGKDKKELPQNFFRDYYLKNFFTITLLLDENPKNIEDIYINLAIIKEQEVQKELQEKLIKREITINSYEEIYKPKEPIDIKKLIKTSKKSLIFGKAGVGKTTLSKYISYMWAKGELFSEFEQIIYLPLREWSSNKGLKSLIRDCYLSKDDEIEIDIKNSSKILFIFDGLDELPEDKKELLSKEIKAYNLEVFIITTRPYGYEKSNFNIQKEYETIGFLDENIDSYIDKFFGDNAIKNDLKKFLNRNRDIKQISYIPLILEMLCTLWQDSAKENIKLTSPMTMTEFYSKIVDNVLDKFAKRKKDKRVYKRANRKKIKQTLGKIAFNGLKKQKIVFDGNFLEDILEEDEIEFLEEIAINSGFLKSDRKDRELLDNKLEFLHLSFQEYFAAYYVANLSKKKQKEIIKNYKFYPYMQLFFAFLSGLIEKKEFLVDSIKSEPKDILGFYELFLLMTIFSQIKKEDIKQKYIEEYHNETLFWIMSLDSVDNVREIDHELLLNKLHFFDNSLKIELIITHDRGILVKSSYMQFMFETYIESKASDNVLINLIKDKNINSNYRALFLADTYLYSGRKDNVTLNTLIIDFIKDKNIYPWVKGKLVWCLSKLGRYDNYFNKQLLKIIKDNDINLWIRISSVGHFLSNNRKLYNRKLFPLKKQFINRYSPYVLEKELSKELFIELYNQNLIGFNRLTNYLFYHRLPLYKKGNNYYIFVNDKEIIVNISDNI